MSIYFELSSSDNPLAVDSIGNHWNQESIKRPKGFPHYHWLQTEKGNGEAVIDGECISLPEGFGVLIAPFVPHSYYSSESGWFTSFVTFSGRLEHDIGKIVGYQRYIPVVRSERFSFQDWIDHTILMHKEQTLDSVQLSIDSFTFLMNINRLKEEHDVEEHPLYQRYVEPIIKEIETRYVEDITIAELAGGVYISTQYLSRLFQRFLGCSTSAYLGNYRIIKAKELLVSRGELEVQQIGFRVGYHDVSHFIVVFKNITGYTPLEFRRLHL